MDDSTFVALLGVSLLADTPVRREAGRILLDIARCGCSDALPLADRDHDAALRAEIAGIADRLALGDLIAQCPAKRAADGSPTAH